MAPQFLLLGPSLAKSFIVRYEYARAIAGNSPSRRTTRQYPLANGQVYGDGERG